MSKAATTAFQAVATTWLIPTSMLAFIRHDVPAGWSLLLLAGTAGTYAYRNLTDRGDAARQHR